MRRLTLALGGVLATVAALTLAPAAQAQETGTVYVVHGIPNTPVDVYVDGQRAIDDFEPGDQPGPAGAAGRAATRSRCSRPTPPTAPARRCCPPTPTCRPAPTSRWSRT